MWPMLEISKKTIIFINRRIQNGIDSQSEKRKKKPVNKQPR
jgi:hypothetical protein